MPSVNHNPYRDALVRARANMGRLDVDAATNIRIALGNYVDDLERNITNLQQAGALSKAQARRLLREAKPIFRAASKKLNNAMQRAISEGRMVSYLETQTIWEETSAMVAARKGLGNVMLGALRNPPITMLGVFESMGSPYKWRTLVGGHVANASAEAAQIFRMGLLEGVGPGEMARRLRPYVQGSEPFQKMFSNVPTITGDVKKLDLRKIPRELRGAARKMKFNAERIAFTEIHNARAEAEVQHMIADPLVKAIKWRLSPFRSFGGSFSPPDVCDTLAVNNFYGLGPGVYPVLSVPPPPHPFDRCEREPVTRATKDIRQPKPNPSATLTPTEARIPGLAKVTTNKAARIRRELGRSLREGRAGSRLGRRLQARGPQGQTLGETLLAPTPTTIVKMQTAMNLREMENMTFKAIGERMGVTTARANRLYNKAREAGMKSGLPQQIGVLPPIPPGPPVQPLPTAVKKLKAVPSVKLTQAQQALTLRQQGLSFKKIGDKMGISRAKAQSLVKFADLNDLKPLVGGTAPTLDVVVTTDLTSKTVVWGERITFGEVKADLKKMGTRAFADAPAEQLAVMQKLPKLKSYREFPGGPNSYNAIGRNINIGNTGQRASATFRHEYGHHVDSIMGHQQVGAKVEYWSSGVFNKEVNAIRARMRASGFAGEAETLRLQKIYLELQNVGDMGTMSHWGDIFGSLTWDMQGARQFGFGHNAGYYAARPHRMASEMFANMWDLYKQKNKTRHWAGVQKAFPELTKQFEDQIWRTSGLTRPKTGPFLKPKVKKPKARKAGPEPKAVKSNAMVEDMIDHMPPPTARGSIQGKYEREWLRKWKNDPLFKPYKKFLENWSGETYKGVKKRANAFLKGKGIVARSDAARGENAVFKAIFDTLANARPLNRKLFKGFVLHNKKPAGVTRMFRVGDTMDTGLGSWSAIEKEAQDFARGITTKFVPRNDVSVIFKVDEGSRALPIHALSDIPDEAEFIMGGRFRILRVDTVEIPETRRLGAFKQIQVTLKQEATFKR